MLQSMESQTVCHNLVNEQQQSIRMLLNVSDQQIKLKDEDKY